MTPSPQIETRRATSDDYLAVCRLFKELDELHAGLLPRHFQRFDGPARPRDVFEEKVTSPEKAMFVASDGSRLVGFIDVHCEQSASFPLFKSREFAMIHNMFVSVNYRGTGLAEALFKHVKQWARDRGCGSLQLTVYSANRRALRFFEKQVFEPLKMTFEQEL
jgi:GNAT superfamily N-acetyltransferase